MQTRLLTRNIDEVEAESLVVLCFEKADAQAPLMPELVRTANERTNGWIAEIYQTGEFAGKPFEMALLHRPAGLRAKRLLAIGCGSQEKFTAADLRKVTGAALRSLKAKASRDICIALDSAFASPEFVSAAVEGAILGDFEPDQRKTDPKKTEKAVDTLSLAIPNANGSVTESAFHRGVLLAESQNFARALVNEPANVLTPSQLAEHARAMAAEQGLECEILDRARMAELGMGALLAVAQGSTQPPALIILRYKPSRDTSGVHLGLVGKGVTFDSGGVSIKPSEGMEKMKYDMAGAAAVLGAMRAIAQLKPSIQVTALVPTVENMVSGSAQRPGDIITSLSGKTIEVLNTDAEGRLILADAITYASRLGCTHLVDAATLTGAIVVALGHIHVGAFTNDEAFLERVLGAARMEGEKMWPMPLDDDYKDYLKSAFADIPNVGGRWGGAITAAMFLKEFVEDKPWVHLDIAGTAWLDDAKPFMSKGPSGVGVRTLAQLAASW
ncbi:MAG: leucyl aminopeptidase [Bryobacteraceae bacterium]|nr:leucyl aminopeptidase [Bryobacteraceae bacterium]